MLLRSNNTETPFCWQNKSVTRYIRKQMNGASNRASVLGVYIALTEIASDEQSSVFEAGQPHIAEYAGISVSTVKRAEKTLEELGVVIIDRPKLRGHNTYKLISDKGVQGLIAHHEPSLAHDERTIVHDDPTIAQSPKPIERTPVEESKKNQKKKIERIVKDLAHKRCGGKFSYSQDQIYNEIRRLGGTGQECEAFWKWAQKVDFREKDGTPWKDMKLICNKWIVSYRINQDYSESRNGTSPDKIAA